MESNAIRLLLLADTHIGLDFPLQPRIERRRRGYDFLNNFRLALKPALQGEVDLVIHGGDLFDRSHVPEALVQIGLEPLLEVAEKNVPVLLVPGNHERSKIPLQLWRNHPYLTIFDQPATKRLDIHGNRVAISGFPFTRKIGTTFSTMLNATRYRDFPADIRLLCMHQSVEGAKVGPINFTFRPGKDVIRGSDLPSEFAAVLSGHIHRAQTLVNDLHGQKLPVPVYYPGSVERTAFAEQKEDKGYLKITLQPGDHNNGNLIKTTFERLPARPMVIINFFLDHQSEQQIQTELVKKLTAIDPNAVVHLRLMGEVSPEQWRVFSAENLRTIAPASMNLEVGAKRTS